MHPRFYFYNEDTAYSSHCAFPTFPQVDNRAYRPDPDIYTHHLAHHIILCMSRLTHCWPYGTYERWYQLSAQNCTMTRPNEMSWIFNWR